MVFGPMAIIELGGLFAMFAIVALGILAFDVWMLVDAIQRPPTDFSSPDAKTWWIVGLAVGFATALPATAVAIAYYLVVRRPAEEARKTGVARETTPPAVAPAQGAAPIHCRNCGAKLAAGARFCHSCGRPTG